MKITAIMNKNENEEDITGETKDNGKEENESENEVVSKILEITGKLNEIDEYFDSLSSLQSKVDEELSDLLHFIENDKNTLNQNKVQNLFLL